MCIRLRNLFSVIPARPHSLSLKGKFQWKMTTKKKMEQIHFSYTARSTFQKNKGIFLNEQGPTQGAAFI